MRCASRSRASSATAKRAPAPRRRLPRARRRCWSSRCARRRSSATTTSAPSTTRPGAGGARARCPRRWKRGLALALREALQLGHNYIGTEHILLGLVRESEGVAARVLSNLDVDPDKVRREVVRMLGGGRAQRGRGGGGEAAGGRGMEAKR